MPKKAPTTVVLRNKSLYLVRRNNTGNWQINYKVPSLKTWQRKTAGTADVEAAKMVAEDWVADIRVAERRGFPLVSKKFKAVADLVSAECFQHAKEGTGAKVYAQFPAIIERYLNPFFGKYNIDAINSALITRFHAWRRELVGRELKQHYVFRMRNGKRPYNFVNSFGDAVRKAGMLTNGRDDDKRSLYSLRHYYATERLYENMSIEKLAEQMGMGLKTTNAAD